MGFFDLHQLPEEPVVLRVGYLRRVENIVTVSVMFDLVAKLGGARGNVHGWGGDYLSGFASFDTLFVVLVVAYVSLLLQAPLPPDWNAVYASLESATRANDAKAMQTWYEQQTAIGYFYTSRDGVGFPRSLFIAGIKDQTAAVKKVISYKQSIRASGHSEPIVVEVTSDFEGRSEFDGVPMKLTDRSVQKDTWHHLGDRWKLTTSKQIASETQMTPLQ